MKGKNKLEFQNKKLEEFEKYINQKKVAIIGTGISNLPLIDYFYKKNSIVTIFDKKEENKIEKDVIEKNKRYKMETSFGEKYLSKLKNFDLILRSPGCLPKTPELIEEEKRGAVITTEIELFIKMCPCKVIGITGSDGKTTTTTLIAEVLEKAGYKVILGGNIGIPPFTKLDEVKENDIAVLELSSFQLMDMDVSPDISIITNITPNHLDAHKTFEEYIDAKKNIFKHQNENGILILNYDNEITKSCIKEANGKVIYFSSKEKLKDGYIVDEGAIKKCEDGIRKHLLKTEDITIKGIHNYENICAVLAAVKDLVDEDLACKVIKEFSGVSHRIEFVRELDGVKWYNDSASTTPSRTLSGLNSFPKERIVLIAGGADKNLDYTPIAKPILDKVEILILMGETSEKIFNKVKEEGERENKKIKTYMARNLEEAIKLAKENSISGQVVLFSPASTSFDMFKNMYERGNIFKELVNKL